MILKYVERYINNEKKRVRNKIDSSNHNAKVDSVDTKILELMVEGKVNKEISTLCKIPISTVQRRARNLISSDLVQNDYRLNYEKLGFKTGLLYIYLRDGDTESIAKKVYDLDGITYVEIHIGNADMLANVIYKDSNELFNLISEIKNIYGVARVAWSEKIYQTPYKKDIINFAINKLNRNRIIE